MVETLAILDGAKGDPMPRAPQIPDRNFSANDDAEDKFESLRDALDNSEPALPYNEAAKTRIGKVISDAVLPSRIRAPLRRVGKRSGLP